MVAAQQLGGETVTSFRSESFRVKSSGSDDRRWYEIRSRLCAENAELIVVEGVFTDVTDLVLADTVDAEIFCLNLKGFNLRLDDLLSESDLQSSFPIAFVNIGFDGFGAFGAVAVGFWHVEQRQPRTCFVSKRWVPHANFVSHEGHVDHARRARDFCAFLMQQ